MKLKNLNVLGTAPEKVNRHNENKRSLYLSFTYLVLAISINIIVFWQY